MESFNQPKLDRRAFEIKPLSEVGDDRDFWRTKTPFDRLATVEYLRRLNYGHDRATARLQRVLEFAPLAGS